jgi:DnaJ-class molecular chaperone
VLGMDKMADPNHVKKYYRKAVMMCHPDKVNLEGVDPDKVYIANRCFSAITEAFNEYKTEPGINI